MSLNIIKTYFLLVIIMLSSNVKGQEIPKLNIGLDIFSANMSIYGNNGELLNNGFKGNLDWHFSILSGISKKVSLKYSNSFLFTQQGRVLLGDSIIYFSEQGIHNQISIQYTSDSILNSLSLKHSFYPSFGLSFFSLSPYRIGQAINHQKKYTFQGNINEGVLYTKIGWGLSSGVFIKNKKNNRLSSLFLQANFEIPGVSFSSNSTFIHDRFFNLNVAYTWYFKMF